MLDFVTQNDVALRHGNYEILFQMLAIILQPELLQPCAVMESETDENIEKQIKIETYGRFLRKLKESPKMSVFHFWTNLAMFHRSQLCDFDAIVHAGAPLGVEIVSK